MFYIYEPIIQCFRNVLVTISHLTKEQKAFYSLKQSLFMNLFKDTFTFMFNAVLLTRKHITEMDSRIPLGNIHTMT